MSPEGCWRCPECQRHDLERARWNAWKAHILQRMASAARAGDDRFGEWIKSADEASTAVSPEDLVVADIPPMSGGNRDVQSK